MPFDGEMTEFEFDHHAVRMVVDADGTPWWVGRDVCAALAIVNSKWALSRLANDERSEGVTSEYHSGQKGGVTDDPLGACDKKGCRVVVDTPGGPQAMVLINEPGLYRLIFTSRKPAAERFKRWLAHEVLPAIRRTGRYEAPSAASDGGDLPLDVHGWLAVVREARRTYGRAAAVQAWEQSPLPQVRPQAEKNDEATALCLDFIRECCVITGGDRDFTPSRELREAARQYCLDTGRPVLGSRTFGNAMLGLVASGALPGVRAVKRSNTGYIGLILAA